MPHQFAWAVKDAESNNDYAHEEKSDGKVVRGSYRVLLPDGRTQVVTYTADENGYRAEVKYEGVAAYPTNNKQYRPVSSPVPAEAAPSPVRIPSPEALPVSVQSSASIQGQGEVSASAVAISSSS